MNIGADIASRFAVVEGVSIGRKDDKSTWRIDYAPGATSAQRTAVEAYIESFDVAAYNAAANSAANAAPVRDEARRRMRLLLGARDDAHLDILISNGTREAVRLLRKGQDNWTEQEAARAAQLEALDTAIEAIRARSNAMETNPPSDYADDSRWQ